jgi:hypothetical protein
MTTRRSAAKLAATVNFEPGWRQTQSDLIRQGDALTIHYDSQRLTACRGTYSGLTGWDLIANVRFLPSGETISKSLIDRSSPRGVPDPPEIVPLQVHVPADATQAEMWFQNTNAWGCSAFDSQFGNNYQFVVDQAGPAQPVTVRDGAIPTLDVVNVFTENISKIKRNIGTGAVTGSQLETRLDLKVWVRNIAFQKNVWIDLHVFDENDERVNADTLTLSYLGPAGGNGDFFTLSEMVFLGSGGVPGNVWPRADARRIQFRVYFEVNGTVFTEGILHQTSVVADAEVSQAKATAAA